MLEEGQIINDIYQVQEPVGEGGAGQVYLAWHKNLKKKVVIKRIKDDYIGRVNERGEADILKNLRHRYLPQVYDFIQMGKEVYTVIDFIDGNSLLEYIQAGIRFDEAQTIKWLKQLLDALDYLHSQKPPIIHSDIKPSNIMVDKNGDICLIDFNISFDENDRKKISGYSEGYASPEQVQKVQMYSTGGNYLGIHIDARSDIFSLGASFYHMMTRLNPIERIKNDENLWDFPLPYSELLVEVIKKSLHRNPDKRYQTAAQMLNDLNTIKLRDRRYKRLRHIQIMYSTVFMVLIAVGAAIISKGMTVKKEEGFETEYQAIMDDRNEMNGEELIDSAIELLNNRKYESLSEKKGNERSNLLYLIANEYFENTAYQNATTYYEQAISYDDNNPEYYRDYAIAEARLGNIDEAEAVLDKGIEKGLKDADLYLVQAEIADSKEDTQNALKMFEKVIDYGADEDTLGRAYLLYARAYKGEDDLTKAFEILEEAYKEVGEIWRIRILREQGAVCVQYIEEHGADNSDVWIKRAEQCYETLSNSAKVKFNDYMNLVLVRDMKGDISGAFDVLGMMDKKYPADYRISMRKAFIEIEKQLQKDETTRNFHNAKEYYEEAERLYEKERISGRSDDEMQYLESVISELHEKGWIEDGR